MALGNSNQNATQKLIVLKIKAKDAEGNKVAPFFSITEKVNGAWLLQDNTVTSVSGVVTGFQVKTGEFKGDVIKSYSLYLADGDETYLVDLKNNMLGRSVVNSILGLESLDSVVEISIYTNKKGFDTAMVRADGEKTPWAYTLDELPAVEKVKFKGKEISDFSAVENFFEEKVKEFAATRLAGKTAAPVKAKEVAVVSKKVVEDAPFDADDDNLF